ncbi:MAG: hypothetical protein J6Z00_01015, partial [Clostridia bacterium]|nr:hypothetical protein [Clostridia bacterium]
RASEQINNLVGTGTRPTIAPATGKKFQPNPTKYYSMANNAEEIPTLVQKVEPLKTDKLLELYNNDAPEWKEIFWKTTDLRKPEIAAELDELMARHPEILNTPEYAKEDVVTLIGTPAAPYTADQIAMVAAIENKPQWIIYAYRRGCYVGNAAYYALKNGHMQLANDILNMGGKSQDAVYQALVQGDEEMAEFIFRRYNVDLEHAEVLQDPLIVRMAEKSAKGVEWLANHGASLYLRGNQTVVSAAANNGQVEVLEMLAQKGLKMDGGFEYDKVFFHPNSVQKLIELGAKVNEKTLSRALRLLGSQIGNKEKFSAVEESFHIIERAL